jgi:hypothetical protein
MHERIRYDHYRVLGIARDATAQEVKRAYRQRVKLCHPDRNVEPRATDLFRIVHEAYETLRDPDRRRAYDLGSAHYRPVRAATERTPTAVSGPPDRPVNRFAFIGLHVTGLCFGVSLIAGPVSGVFLLDWPPYILVFSLLGLVVIPDSISGLRTKCTQAQQR